MGRNLYTIDLGSNHVLAVHDWDIRAQAGVRRFLAGDTPPHWDGRVVVVYHQDLHSVE